MSFVTLGGDGATRPTFFELVAAERLMPSLKAAISYSIAVLAQQRPWLHKVLDYEEEVFAIVCAALDRQALAASSATFADSLYGLRRTTRASAASSVKDPHLSHRQQRSTVLLSVLSSYLFTRLDSLYQKYRPQIEVQPGTFFARRQGPQTPHQGYAGWWRHMLMRWFLRAYPWIHASHEGLRFAYQLLYLLENTAYFSPLLHLLGQRVVRVTSQELGEAQRRTSDRRKRQLHRAGMQYWPLAILQRLWLRASYGLADHTRNALILSVFAFKLLEWWYMSGEERLAANQKQTPPPPPPAPPMPHPEGVSLPSDPSVCPLCLNKRTNPAMAVVSGYVFCYPCLFNFVGRGGCCPITRIPMTVAQMRRLYQSA
ncbi:hypothetical protein WJX73_000250 [Symbiochloris irregularis]|uniref:Peroxisome biogenesis protein 12 n=1 Tax=Symbiochloris irregularis TaxID=706552 RepID=A0AAW1NXW3_9CHLO